MILNVTIYLHVFGKERENKAFMLGQALFHVKILSKPFDVTQ